MQGVVTHRSGWRSGDWLAWACVFAGFAACLLMGQEARAQEAGAVTDGAAAADRGREQGQSGAGTPGPAVGGGSNPRHDRYDEGCHPCTTGAPAGEAWCLVGLLGGAALWRRRRARLR